MARLRRVGLCTEASLAVAGGDLVALAATTGLSVDDLSKCLHPLE